MSYFQVTKSPYRQFLIGLAGIILVLAALDVLWLHKLSSPPLEDDSGVVTTKGDAWRRTDLIWGSVFLLSGSALFAVAAAGLASGRPVVELGDDGVRLRLAGPTKTVTIPWDEVVGSRVILVDGDGVQPRPVLSIAVVDPTRYPYELWGAEWVDGRLHVDADGWSDPPEDVAVRIELGREQWRYHQARVDSDTETMEDDPSGDAVPPDTTAV